MAKSFIKKEDVEKIPAKELADTISARHAAKQDIQPMLRQMVMKLGLFPSLPDDAEIVVSYTTKVTVTPPPSKEDPAPKPREEVKRVYHNEKDPETPQEAPAA